MPINFRHKTIIDSLSGGISPWSLGSGTVGIWTQAGLTSENERVEGTDPFGDTSIVWESRPTGSGSNVDGGWVPSSCPSLDNTKLYRFSVWIKRTSTNTSGRYYFGCDGGPCGVEVKNVYNDTNNTNPYWHYNLLSTLTLNTWYLFVGHVFPVDYPLGVYGDNVIKHPNTGVWTRSGGKIAMSTTNTMGDGDVKFGTTSATGVLHRTFHYDSTSTAAHLQFYDPRIELCDGSEGTVESLLEGPTTYSGNTLGSTSITKEGSAFKTQEVIATGGDWIEEFGEWRAHVFTGSGTFDLQSYVGSAAETDYLIVAGGGGGGARMGGGGGGGGVITGYAYLTGTTYSITVGAGGAAGDGGAIATYRGTNGGNSTFNGLIAIGGGAGGGGYNNDGKSAGLDGGSGGGASAYDAGTPPSPTYGSGTAGQGHDGGAQGTAYYGGSGGGGMTAGTTATTGVAATGGTGTFSTILGRPHYWGAGGGCAGYSWPHGGAGGPGGGGGAAPGTVGGKGGEKAITWGIDGASGSSTSSTNGGAGGAWSGGGGGGGAYSVGDGGDGGSGIVIIRYKYR